jgi:ATP-dependent DNA ligase
MKSIPKENLENAEAYKKAIPKQFGDLHERMKFLVEKIREFYAREGHSFDVSYDGLRVAVFDLETEVKFYEPQNPPFGSRPKPRTPR